MLHFTKESLSLKCQFKSFLLIILGALLTAWLFVGCGQRDRNQPIGIIDLGRVGNKAIPATVYIEVINRAETAEPLPSFTAAPLFSRYFDVDMLNRKFSNERLK